MEGEKMKITLITLAIGLPAGLLAQSLSDQQFVDQAAQIDMTEAHVGQMAQDKSSAQDVKDYGKKMENDHKSDYDKLTAAAQDFTVPKGIDTQHQMEIDKLDKLSGHQFDQQFRQKMVQDHQKAIDLYQRASTELQNTQLKNYASQALPVLQEHLQLARDLGEQSTARNSKHSRNDQSVGQDLKDAGENTTDAVKKGAQKTGHAMKKATHKAASGIEDGAEKVKEKTSSTSSQ
jgi:putative membrane protein